MGVAADEISPPGAERRTRQLQLAALGVAVVTVAVGLTLRLGYGRLGTALSPFVSGWLPSVDLLWLPVGLGGLLVLIVAGSRLPQAQIGQPAAAAALWALAAGVGTAINTIRQGPAGLTEIFDLHGGTADGHAINEYLPGLPTLEHGVGNYLDRFAETVTSQTVNVAGHPPGPLLLLRALGVDDPGDYVRQAAIVIVLGACCAPLAYRLALNLGRGEPVARWAGVLCAASPLTLLVGVTSMDYVYAAAAATAACGLTARSRGWQLAGLLALAAAALLSWALLAIAAWAVLLRWRTDGLRAAVRLALACGAAVALTQGMLAAIWGYDPLGTLRATEQVYRDSLARVRPYSFWVFGSPVAWLVMLGVPIVAIALRGLAYGDAVAVATFATIAIAALGGFTKAETERIWLFFVPLICVAAAPWLDADRRTTLPGRPTRGTAALIALAAQALVVQLLLNTVW